MLREYKGNALRYIYYMFKYKKQPPNGGCNMKICYVLKGVILLRIVRARVRAHQ